MPREILEFDDLTPFLLLKNGNYLYKVPFRDGWAVLKVYYGSRPMWEMVAKSFGNVVFEGQTSYMPKTRLEMERECLSLWRKHGFRVFGTYDDVEVRAPHCPPGGYLLLEYVDAPKLIDHMRDGDLSVEERLATWRRFLPEWGRRHEIAVREREPRLVHENGDTKHVMLHGDELLWFDFEMVFRSRSRVEEYVGHEIIQYIWNLLRALPEDLHEPVLSATVEDYPHPRFLAAGHEVFLNHPKLLHRWGRSIDRRRARSKKPSSKYAVAERIQAML